MDRLIKWLRLLKYNRSIERRHLDIYIKRIRRLEALTTTEWEEMKRLAKYEIETLQPEIPSSQTIVHKNGEVKPTEDLFDNSIFDKEIE